jgi:serine/threonine protein kinase
MTTDHPCRSIVGCMNATPDNTTLRSVEAPRLDPPVVEPTGRLVAGRYRLQSKLGRGSMGVVWLARDEMLTRSVALKQVIRRDLLPEEEARPAAVALALGEARAAARVHHRGVVSVHDVVEDDGLVWIVMERLSGRTLGEALDADGPLPVSEVTRVGLWLLEALRSTHQAGFVHRDVKPDNVYLCDDGRVVLTDFGISRAIDDKSTVRGGEFLGSPAYVAPEQADGGDVGPASDLFSFGATLFAAVEGEPPFRRGSILATLIAVIEDAPGPFQRAGALRPLIEGLLAKEPAERLSPDAARAALEATRSTASRERRGLRRLWPIRSAGDESPSSPRRGRPSDRAGALPRDPFPVSAGPAVA